MTNWQKNTIDFVLKIEVKTALEIIYKKKLHTFAVLNHAYITIAIITTKKEIHGKEFSNCRVTRKGKND